MYKIVNKLEDKIIFKTNDEQKLINFVLKIVKENNDLDTFTITNVVDCSDYIRDFCDNLEFHKMKLHLMNEKPKNKSRVLIASNDFITFRFAFYENGVFKVDDEDNKTLPHLFDGWISISELKDLLIIPSLIM